MTAFLFVLLSHDAWCVCVCFARLGECGCRVEEGGYGHWGGEVEVMGESGAYRDIVGCFAPLSYHLSIRAGEEGEEESAKYTAMETPAKVRKPVYFRRRVGVM